MSQFKQTFGDVKHRVEDLLTAGPFLATKNLEQAIKEHHRYINEQKSIMQSLSLVFSFSFLMCSLMSRKHLMLMHYLDLAAAFCFVTYLLVA
jgi:hypothetical protein